METRLEPPSETKKPVVIFYDCCVPENFVRTFSEALSFAQHIFVNHRFSQRICRNDKDLFSEIHRLSTEFFQDSLIIFVTLDRGFSSQVEKDHPGWGVIKIVTVKSVSSVSRELAIKRVREALHTIFDNFLDVLEPR